MFHVGFLLLFLALNPTATDLLRTGLQALQQGRLQAAQTDLTQASSQDPQNPLIWVSLAQLNLRLQNPGVALADAAKAEKTGADNAVILHSLALFYAEAHQPGRAGALEQRVAERGSDPAAYDRAAKYFLAAGDEASAIRLATEAAARNPELAFEWARVFLQRRDFTPAADLLEPALKVHPDDPQLTLALGVARYGQRRFEDAIADFVQVIRIDPGIPQPYEFLGRMLDQAGTRLPEITQLFQTYADKNPVNPRPALLTAKSLLLADPDDKRAEALLRTSISLDANDWESHYELGVLLERQHQYAQSAVELARAEELNGQEAAPHYHLARVYDRLGQPDKAAAERALHSALTAAAKK